VRFSHSVFALPFALVGALLAGRTVPLTWTRLGWIAVCMVTARSAAMGFNRLADAAYDARNPRTANRELPRGRMSRAEAIGFVIVASAAFVWASSKLGPVCFALSPVALGIVFWYSLAKRFTSYTQLFLGLAMAVAPVGGWLAAGGGGGWTPWLLGLAIGAWVGGFDVLYACQDLDVDRREGLRSIPVRFGVPASLRLSRGMHVVTVAALAALGVVDQLGAVYLLGVLGVAVLLVWEQSLVRADDLSQVKRAFDMNGWVGILYFFTTAVALYWK
jgi:4-hydroxybenzoate polyprenyltransferase